MNLSPGLYSWWGPTVWRLGAVALWLYKLRRLNGPAFTWPLLLFANALPERLMQRMGKIYAGRPLQREEPAGTARQHQAAAPALPPRRQRGPPRRVGLKLENAGGP